MVAAQDPSAPSGRVVGARSAYALFRRLSRARGRRFFHPAGVAYRARLVGEEGFPGLAIAAPGREHAAVVRFSRALGVPRPLPDFLGLGVRVLDAYGTGAHQDLLLVSAGTPGPLKAVPRPATSFFGPSFSTLLPYRVTRRLALLGAVAQTPRRASHLEALAELVATAERGEVRFALGLALTPAFDDWQRVGSLPLEERLPDAESRLLRFNPANTGGGLELAAWPNRIRDPAYRGSQSGRADDGD